MSWQPLKWLSFGAKRYIIFPFIFWYINKSVSFHIWIIYICDFRTFHSSLCGMGFVYCKRLNLFLSHLVSWREFSHQELYKIFSFTLILREDCDYMHLVCFLLFLFIFNLLIMVYNISFGIKTLSYLFIVQYYRSFSAIMFQTV